MNDTPKPDLEAGVDFARPGPVAEPAPEVTERARQEAQTGTPQLRAVGFYLSMARRTGEKRPPARGGRYAILVIEDDADLAQLVIDIFMTAGFEVRWAANRAEINAELHRPGVDLVLLDIVLPDADGLQVLRRVREHPTLSNLPIIMMTGRVAPEDILAGLAAGADGYVTKPFRMSGLVNAVNVVLGIA